MECIHGPRNNGLILFNSDCTSAVDQHTSRLQQRHSLHIRTLYTGFELMRIMGVQPPVVVMTPSSAHRRVCCWHSNFVFAERRYANTVYAVVLCLSSCCLLYIVSMQHDMVYFAWSSVVRSIAVSRYTCSQFIYYHILPLTIYSNYTVLCHVIATWSIRAQHRISFGLLWVMYDRETQTGITKPAGTWRLSKNPSTATYDAAITGYN